jgi:integrase
MAGYTRKRVHPPSKRHPNGLIRWQAALELEPHPVTGKRRTQRQDFPTKREAQVALAQWQVQQQQGLLVERSNQTVAEMMAYWLETYASTKKPRTYANYQDEVRRYIRPYAINSLAVQDLRAKHVLAWHTALRNAGKSPHAIHNAHLRLQQALDQAVSLGIVPRNEAKLIKPPAEERKPERPTWTADEARRFLEHVATGSIYGPIWRLSLATGMRRGELLGLRWADINWQERCLRVTQSIGPVHHVMLTGTPKSKAGERELALTEPVLEVLRQHRAQQNARRLALGPAWQDHDLVFCSDIGTPINPSNLYREYHKLVAAAGVPYITIHDQRHTASTWAVAAGVDLKSLSEVFGHEDVQTTLDKYTHTSKHRRRQAMQAIDDILTGARPDDEQGRL